MQITFFKFNKINQSDYSLILEGKLSVMSESNFTNFLTSRLTGPSMSK